MVFKNAKVLNICRKIVRMITMPLIEDFYNVRLTFSTSSITVFEFFPKFKGTVYT